MIRDAFGEDSQVHSQALPLVQAKKNSDRCPPFIIATVTQRAEAMQESSALAKLLPGSQFIVQDYANFGQLKAHGQIARDLTDVRNPMTERLIRFVHSSR